MGAAQQDLKYSEAGGWAVAAMAAATIALIAATPGPAGLRILAATWTACMALHALHRLRATRSLDPTLAQDGSFVAPWLTIVRVRRPGARFDRTVVILPGMLPEEEFRELRVRLKWS